MYEVVIQENWTAMGLDVFVIQRGQGEVHLLRPDGNIERIAEGSIPPGPTFTLHESTARSLLDKLTQHYQGASDLHTVRGDLLHERGRVDKMLDTISQLATRPQDLHVHKAE